MIGDRDAFIRRFALADAMSDDNIAKQQFSFSKAFIVQFIPFRHWEGEDVGGLVLAAPVGVECTDLVVIGQTDQKLDRSPGTCEIGERALSDGGFDGFARQRLPGEATVPFLIGFECDFERHAPTSRMALWPAVASSMLPSR